MDAGVFDHLDFLYLHGGHVVVLDQDVLAFAILTIGSPAVSTWDDRVDMSQSCPQVDLLFGNQGHLHLPLHLPRIDQSPCSALEGASVLIHRIPGVLFVPFLPFLELRAPLFHESPAQVSSAPSARNAASPTLFHRPLVRLSAPSRCAPTRDSTPRPALLCCHRHHSHTGQSHAHRKQVSPSRSPPVSSSLLLHATIFSRGEPAASTLLTLFCQWLRFLAALDLIADPTAGRP